MKHLEETINQYHIQSEKNLEGKNKLTVILIFSEKKLCTRIILKMSNSFLHFSRAIEDIISYLK